MRHYRALISVPIQARSDDEAQDQAAGWADLIRHGHVELVTEVEPGELAPSRLVDESPGFRNQIPLALI